jgi:hypothetical protein
MRRDQRPASTISMLSPIPLRKPLFSASASAARVSLRGYGENVRA